MAVIGELHQIPELPENFQLIGRIGRGGAGEVFSVQDVTGKHLAFKRINSAWQQHEFESIRALRALPAHPALTQIFHAGVLSDNDFYYTMELADNAGDERCYMADTLAYRMLSRQIPLDELCRILLDTAAGAGHLHNNGLFHGDIKPENIIFVNGQVKLADFGTVKSPSSAGTPGFAPDNPQSGVDCDCYAICKILYCAWSGLDESMYPSLPETFVPAELKLVRRIYLDGCAENFRRRFKSAESLQNALQFCLDNISKPQFMTPARRYALKLGIGAAVGVLALTGAFVAGNRQRNMSANRVAAAYEADRAGKIYGVEKTPELSPREKLLESSEYKQAISVIEQARWLYTYNDYWGGGEAKKDFEYLLQNHPDKLAELDKNKMQKVQKFYQDMDKFHALYEQLASGEITPEERIKLYKDSGFEELHESLRKNLTRPDALFLSSVVEMASDAKSGRPVRTPREELMQSRAYRDACRFIELSGKLGNDYQNIRPMRKIFETVFERCPEQLDPKKVQNVQKFYQDLDRLHALRQELASEKITPEERLKLFQTSGFRGLYNFVLSRSLSPDRLFVNKVLQLYYKLEDSSTAQD